MPPMLYESKRSSEVKVNDLDSLYEKIGEYYFLQLSQSDRISELSKWGYDHKTVLDINKYLTSN